MSKLFKESAAARKAIGHHCSNRSPFSGWIDQVQAPVQITPPAKPIKAPVVLLTSCI